MRVRVREQGAHLLGSEQAVCRHVLEAEEVGAHLATDVPRQLQRRVEHDHGYLEAACRGVGVRVYGVLIAGCELEDVTLLLRGRG